MRLASATSARDALPLPPGPDDQRRGQSSMRRVAKIVLTSLRLLLARDGVADRALPGRVGFAAAAPAQRHRAAQARSRAPRSAAPTPGPAAAQLGRPPG